MKREEFRTEKAREKRRCEGKEGESEGEDEPHRLLEEPFETDEGREMRRIRYQRC